MGVLEYRPLAESELAIGANTTDKVFRTNYSARETPSGTKLVDLILSVSQMCASRALYSQNMQIGLMYSRWSHSICCVLCLNITAQSWAITLTLSLQMILR